VGLRRARPGEGPGAARQPDDRHGQAEADPRVIISTQAPNDDHPLSQLIDDGLGGEDPSDPRAPDGAPEDADPFALETLRVQPALGIFLDEGDLLKEASGPGACRRSSRPTETSGSTSGSTPRRRTGWRPRPVWRLGATPVDLERLGPALLRRPRPVRQARPDGAGAGVSRRRAGAGYDIVPFFWTPEGAMEGPAPAERTASDSGSPASI
jgi:hypothetical protein